MPLAGKAGVPPSPIAVAEVAMGVKTLAIVSMFCAALAAGTAEAEIEISPDAPAVKSPLFLRNPPSTSVVILLQEAPAISVPTPYPGGCFNCSTLPSNRSNATDSIFRSHALSQKLFKPDSGSQILYFH
jgi:hypothetical protein